MENLRHNKLLINVIIVYGLFLVVGGFFIERPYVSSATGIMGLAVGVIFAYRYTVPAYRILFLQERGEFGGHNSILGAAEIAYGMIYSGMFRLLWIHFGKPEAWTSTMLSSLGLFMIAKGAFRLALSPSDAISVPNFPSSYLNVILWVCGLVVAFIAGTYVQ